MPSPEVDRSPATLFMRYWDLATRWTPTQRAASSPPQRLFHSTCLTMLANETAEAAHDQVESLVEAKVMRDDLRRGRVLAAMDAMDEAFYEIHPRSLARTTSSGGTVSPATWLRDLRSDRQITGEYARTDLRRLIPRGPLLRSPRNQNASSGDALADRFRSLAVVPISLQHDDRVVEVLTRVIAIDVAVGVTASVNVGAERVGFAPLATNLGQIQVAASWRGGRLFADYRPAPSFDAAAAAMAAINGLGEIDVVLMPELTLGADHVARMSSELGGLARPLARIVVGGSNLTTDLVDGMPFNECRVMNGRGAELWRQRKVWTAGVDRERAIDLRLPDPGDGALVLEATACGGELIVADIDGFGRCVVLICQDFTTPLLALETVSRFQPDWVFVPILDKSIGEGRWAHSRAYALSELSQARFLAVTNTSFAGAYDPSKPEGMGLAVGPKEPVDRAEQRRAFAIVPRPDPTAPAWSVVTWLDGGWQQSVLGAK